jgi:dTDP-4-amino-4,6-dideoxygalactose transaminase
VTSAVASREVTLPLYARMSLEDVHYVAEAVGATLKTL